jgi:catalase-peroxidase
MGPIARYLGPLVPKETLLWQDPIPTVDHPLISEQDIAALKTKVLSSGLSVSQLVATAGRRRRRSVDPASAVEQTARVFASPRRRTGSQPADATGQGALDARSDPEGVQRIAAWREDGLARRPDRPRGGAAIEGREGGWSGREVSFTPGQADASQ